MFAFFFFNDTATTEIYTLSLHDALPISPAGRRTAGPQGRRRCVDGPWSCETGLPSVGAMVPCHRVGRRPAHCRSEEHTSELQSRQYLVCRLLLEKKKHYKLRYVTRLKYR